MASEIDLGQLIAYDRWANQEALASVAAAGSAPPRALALLAHIAGAEWLWWTRVQPSPSRLIVWPTLTLDQCAAELRAVSDVWEPYVANLGPGGLASPVSYTNSRGEAWTSSVRDILLHVVLHSAYHRGQIATAVRASGHEPAYTDFVHAVRQGLIE
jgi:uncharacterized damage-inducible protein DinB